MVEDDSTSTLLLEQMLKGRNIPYGSIDIERLIESFVPDPQRERFAITEKGMHHLKACFLQNT